ncbi:MAG: hypothetical protein C5B58_14455 [Acidobacteria bacterium]|nr:MAG: hypothetical protein C5B58_14455 [Acidobacteriota bacterium]
MPLLGQRSRIKRDLPPYKIHLQPKVRNWIRRLRLAQIKKRTGSNSAGNLFGAGVDFSGIVDHDSSRFWAVVVVNHGSKH